LELFLLLLLQLLQLTKFLFPEIVLVVKTLIFVVAVDHLRRRCRHNDAVDFKLPGPLPSLLLQVHLLNVVSRQRSLPFDGRADHALLLLLTLLLLLLRLLVFDVVVVILLRSVRRAENRNDRRLDVLPVFGARRFRRHPSPTPDQNSLVDVARLQLVLDFEVLVSQASVF